jgi:hypothetical protein
MRLDAGMVKRGGTFLGVLGAATLTPALALAIETGPPNLPPPPPPPMGAPPAAPPPPHPSRAPASSPPAASQPAVSGGASASASVSTSADTGTTSSDAGMHALDTRWFISPMIGYLSDYLDFGIGLRGGKTLDNHVYVGGTFIYQLGESESGTVAAPQGPATTYSVSTGGFYVGPEAGYDFDLRYVVVRPFMGLGIFNWTGSATSGGVTVSNSGTKFVVWPGCDVLWNVPNSNFFIGADLRIVSVPNAAVGFYAIGGLHFGS